MITLGAVGRGLHRLRHDAWMKRIEKTGQGLRGGEGRKPVGWADGEDG